MEAEEGVGEKPYKVRDIARWRLLAL